MDHSLLSYHSNLAQMPTDQREHEQHLSVQTASSDAESFLLVNASQPYSPCPPGENWSAFRSNPAPGSMLPFRQPGYTSDAWGATVSNPYELDSDQILWDLVPETIHHSSFYLTPQPTASSRIAPPYSMNTHLIPSASKREDTDYLWDKAASVASLFLPHGNPRQRPTPINTAEANALAIRTSPLSPSTSISSQQSPAHSLDSMSPTTSAATDATSPQTSFGDNSDPDSGAESPYSKLIWDALKSAPGNKMQLQEIYAWFEKNTSRGKDRNKGWQNSIRHNLSMNAVRSQIPRSGHASCGGFFTDSGAFPGLRGRQGPFGKENSQLLVPHERGCAPRRAIHHALPQSQSPQDDGLRSPNPGPSAVQVEGWEGRETCGQDAPYQLRRAPQGTQCA